MINLEQALAFVTTVETGSFSAAARKLQKSQSSVSIGVSNLEEELGVQLFDRSSGKPVLTENAERLYNQAKLLLRQAEKMSSFSLAINNDVESRVVIGVDPMAPLTCLDSILLNIDRTFSETEVEIRLLEQQALYQALQDHSVDIGVHFSDDVYPNYLNFMTTHQYEWLCVCSPDYPLAQIDEISNEEILASRQIISKSIKNHPVMSKTTILSQDTWEADNLIQCGHMIELGLGWGILPVDWCAERFDLGTLVAIYPEFNNTKLYSALDVIWAANRTVGPVCQSIIDQLAIRKSNSR